MNTKVQDSLDLSADLLVGLTDIAAFLGWERGKVFRMLTAGSIPGRLLNGKWHARRSELNAALTFAKPGEAGR